ncbi:amino acid transporter, putative [Trypanosoma brucei gambiense DAL972]|uniref:Amino acid transporter, putative n=1 Tax=Trypanosoma brucei gambiense (strain MHOM/CI/86/DAL972) TaxID=679716 RepID=C9ZWX3_TRYB9|nr:amino acid transporter, putative [Trypanosoma brucei gambiense DAL972]CBH13912.1 amino acid transporter, putative [Trypanosoma brucei gambiense DAL972]|eukprot:XP_011776188.1 amino acid transporter, putative [Trypanosoma brucei gambiense DAL972]
MTNQSSGGNDRGRRDTDPFAHAGDVKLSSDAIALDVTQKGQDDVVKEVKPSLFAVLLEKFIPHGGLWSCALNLASATLGAGICSLPTGFNLSGIVMSCIYLVCVAVGTVYSLNLLAKVAVKTGSRNYGEAAKAVMGPLTGYYAAALMIAMCFGGNVAYIIIIGIILRALFSRDGVPEYLKSESGNRLMTSMVWLVIILPMCIPKQVNSLRHLSFVGVMFIVYFSCVVIGHSINKIINEGVADDIVYMRTGNSALDGLSLFLFSFICQSNAFEIFREMKHRSPQRFTIYGTVGMSMCAVLYFLVGLFGYLEFGGDAIDTVLSLYDPGENVAVAIAYIGVAAKVCVAFALHIIPMRDALYHCTGWHVDTVPYWKHSLIVTSITLAALLMGLFIPKASTVFGLVGAFCGGHIGLVLPPLFYMYSGGFTREKVGNIDFFGTYLLLFVGVVAVVFGTVSTIYNTVP